ncbi:glutamine-fructose-6-phosphate transaminase (isomerizing) [Filifactor alocis ATCC 35896]|uniref:Glutamine--fructose-6-phosphate aminotransferase [isomerizing] n=1 Tax=Filifactor alocis (strain ATCC 35896 / CCUG 47790 / D40 B5) TaxID=546269 RepID=D6GSZ2_FILAD|nr:glutamine--fructose-6-phosphate transaminase (isomerizing) [Filifactor alocis]EFE27977.1 glutamine-fructose-6-phosphate transaminase (isomerizing) [Filifactor alocis ATCC 35896]
MCGIVGYIGKSDGQKFVLNGLEKLEYRGYDSSGIVTVSDNRLHLTKKKGRLQVLRDELEQHPLRGHLALGHTRWATHGAPSDVNAHPHTDEKSEFAIVHNGIIENYMELKHDLQEKGHHFLSDTDTEVIAHLLAEYDTGNLLDTVYEVKKHLQGAYALGIVSKNEPDTLIAVRKESPLIIGVGKEENFIASDIPAILEHTRDVYFIENGEVVVLTKDNVTIFDENRNLVTREVKHIDWDMSAATKAGYPHFMLKEIHEQPQAIRDTVKHRLQQDGTVSLGDVAWTKELLQDIHKIYIVACGTAYNAGRVGKVALERLTGIPVETDLASEFRYRDPFVNEHTLLILVSQSGETADTLAALREGKRKGARIFSVTNVIGSSIARESDDVFYTWAGPEIAVASTKAYTTQLVAFYLIAMNMALLLGKMERSEYDRLLTEILALSDKIELMLKKESNIKQIADSIKDKNAVFYLGRNMDYNSAMEGALKLKEISYIFTEAFAAGELKHGTIALIEEGTPVITIATQTALLDKTFSNMQEVKARGAHLIAFTRESATTICNEADVTVTIPECPDLLMPVVSIVPAQLLAYYTSVLKGNDVDKPRNLAKSVTVE